ncbi:MAG: protein TolR [Pseudomonadota bacterium]|nr:protein TolR [Pseudomonadota bacterium]
MSYSTHRRKKRLMGEINVVPYIDVMLVLLVIFMVTTPLLTEGVRVDLPQADAKQLDEEDAKEPFLVTVDESGNFYLNDNEKQVQSAQEIRIKAAAVLRRNPETPFMVRGDRRVDYESVIQAMVLLQGAGVENIGLVTENPPEQE